MRIAATVAAVVLLFLLNFQCIDEHPRRLEEPRKVLDERRSVRPCPAPADDRRGDAQPLAGELGTRLPALVRG